MTLENNKYIEMLLCRDSFSLQSKNQCIFVLVNNNIC